MSTDSYLTRGGVRVHRTVDAIPVTDAVEPLIEALDAHRGGLFTSSYEYPGRYTRWDMGFADPPLVLTARGRTLEVQALNTRGEVLLGPVAEALGALDAVESASRRADAITAVVRAPEGRFAEEERSRQPSVFS